MTIMMTLLWDLSYIALILLVLKWFLAFLAKYCSCYKDVVILYNYKGVVILYKYKDVVILYKYKGIVILYKYKGVVILYKYKGIVIHAKPLIGTFLILNIVAISPFVPNVAKKHQWF